MEQLAHGVRERLVPYAEGVKGEAVFEPEGLGREVFVEDVLAAGSTEKLLSSPKALADCAAS